MSQDRPRYRCPKCGATAALLIPEPMLRVVDVALKCIMCSQITRHPRDVVSNDAGHEGSTRSLD